MDKKENAVKAIEYLDNWLKANRDSYSSYYDYLNSVADRVDEMFEIYENGKPESISQDTYLASFQKDYI